MDALKLGDTVQLKSGGPKMTVVVWLNDLYEPVQCVWHNVLGDLQRASFIRESLDLVDPPREYF